MGRHCGYLALVAGIVSEADFVFIPEWPPETNWPEKLCKKLEIERESGHRLAHFYSRDFADFFRLLFFSKPLKCLTYKKSVYYSSSLSYNLK